MRQYALDALEPNRDDATLVDPDYGERHECHMVGGRLDVCQTATSCTPDNRSPRCRSK